jgi:hypothetical protein
MAKDNRFGFREYKQRSNGVVFAFGTSILIGMRFIEGFDAKLASYAVTAAIVTLYASITFQMPAGWRYYFAAPLAGVLWPLWYLADLLDILNCRIEISFRATRPTVRAATGILSQTAFSQQPTLNSNIPSCHTFGVEEARPNGSLLLRCHKCLITEERGSSYEA